MQDEKEKNNFIKPHISEETWIAFSDNTLPSAEYCKLLEHTASCTWCAEKFAMIMEQGPMAILPPAYLKDQIREHAKSIPMQSAKSAKEISRRMQLFWYSLKVSGAVAMSLLVLFFAGAMQWNNREYFNADDADLWQEWESDWTGTAEENATDLFLNAVDQAADDVTNEINIFAYKLLNWNFNNSGGQ